MSGEVVVFSGLGLDGTGLLLAGSLAWAAVQAVIDQRRAEAERQRRERKQRVEAWQTFQLGQQQQMEGLAKAQTELQARLESLRNAEKAAAPALQETRVNARGFLASQEQLAAQGARLEGLERLLSAVPAALEETPDAPFVRLRAELGGLQQQVAQGHGPDPRRLDIFALTVERTLQQQVEHAERRQATTRRLLAESEALLDQVLLYQGLAPLPGQVTELEALQQGLLALLARGNPTLSDIDLLQRKFAQLRDGVDTELQRAASHQTLDASIDRHLTALGYQRLAEAGEGQSDWAIPGGERLRVALHQDLRLAFQVQHERFEASAAPMDHAEHTLLRRQEARWCDDLKELIKRLNGDGIQYSVQFERQLPEDGIPIVVVEEVDEILAEEERWDAAQPKARSFE